MVLTTPFHERVATANQTQLWRHWAGYLVADKYQISEKFEYFAIRNSVGVFDTSPLYKYRITGPEAESFLTGVLARDIRTCRPGSAQYTIWCDDRGFVNEDGVVLRLSDDEFLLTAAEPNLAYFSDLAESSEVDVMDVSAETAALAVQGPRSARVLSRLDPAIDRLGYFEVGRFEMAGGSVVVSRTGFTGDLGYEIWTSADHALDLWDAIFAAGADHGIIPFGQTALLMARIEAGLLLLGADFEPSRFAFNDAHRSTPHELGLGWMLPEVRETDRRFIGREAIRRELREGATRWRMRGLVVDPIEHQRTYTGAGLIPRKDHIPVTGDMMVYGDDHERVGYATSFMYSPMLQTHIALARVTSDRAEAGTRLNLEFTVDHEHVLVAADVAPLPLFRPDRKTA